MPFGGMGGGMAGIGNMQQVRSSYNRCLSNWATVVCQKEELSTHWISLYVSYSQFPKAVRWDGWGHGRLRPHATGALLFSLLLSSLALSDTTIYEP